MGPRSISQTPKSGRGGLASYKMSARTSGLDTFELLRLTAEGADGCEEFQPAEESAVDAKDSSERSQPQSQSQSESDIAGLPASNAYAH